MPGFPRAARWFAGLALASFIFGSAAAAQEAAASREWNDLEKEIRSKRTKIVNMLKGEASVVEQEFDAYYDLVLRSFAHQHGGAQIAKTRERIKAELKLSGNAPTQTAHDRLTALLLQRMPALYDDATQFADEAHGRLVRGNAMLVIAELNSVEVQGNNPATPLPEALPLLIAAFNNANYPDSLRIFAQVGLLRHAESGIADPNRLGQVQDAMLTMLATATPPAGWSEDGLLWARLRACDILGALKQPGAGNGPAAVVTALSQVVEDEASPLLLRGAAAKGLGQIDYQTAGDVNYSKLAQALASLSVEVARKANAITALQEHFVPIEVALVGPTSPQEDAAGPIAGTIQAWADATPHKQYVDLLAEQFKPVRTAVHKEVDLKAVSEAVNSFDGWLNDNPPAVAAN